MLKSVSILAIPLLLLTLQSCSQPPVNTASAAGPLTEKQKIEKLIQIVTEMKGAQFIRKGTTYDCKAAAQFMQGKWNWKSSEIKTARDFVRICSAGGSGEGAPYYVKFTDGTQVASKDLLGRELDRIEGSQSAGR